MQLLSFISSQLRRKVLTYFFTHPDEKFYIRETASLLGVDAGNLSKELKRLSAEGLFKTEQKGRIRFYYLNSGYPLFRELKEIIFKSEGLESRLRDLVNTFPEIKTALIYGSYAKGEERAGSDVDLILVGTPNRNRLTSKIRVLEDQFGREINFTLYASAEFDRKSREKGSFLFEVLKGKKVILKGK
ncbi:MAG: nucleotidyltransferase domain-containing protein [Candidatus Omnitrophica bacterium]|nr:nucleotidyltransferase domain-containing protein [Candidatus Omnitrophota bacterium]